VAVGTFQNFAYIIGDEETKTGVIADPAWEVDKLLKMIDDPGLKVKYVINTHSHHDHIQGNDAVVRKTGAKLVAHAKSPVKRDIAVNDEDTLDIGTLKAKIIYTPGHCPDHICVLVEGKLLTGDLLFVGECGRTDLAGSNPSEMYDSLFKKILPLEDSVEVYPGHDYGKTPSSTIGYERQNNYVLKPRTREEFVKFMAEP
jgi:glyoxylase-like metal-dependent hydrolase (beta-lactamase superfamily II)